MFLTMFRPKKEEISENTDDFKQPDVSVNKILNIDDWTNIIMLEACDDEYIKSVQKLDEIIQNTATKDLIEVTNNVYEIFPKFYCPCHAKPRLDAISKYIQEKSYGPFTMMPAKTLEKYIDLYMNEYNINQKSTNKYLIIEVIGLTILFSKIFL